MRFSSAISLGLGLVIVVPAVSSPQTAGELRHALSETVRALTVLTGLEKDAPSRTAEQTVELARSATEPAFGDERSRDEQLQYLRKDVGRLQMAHDELAIARNLPTADSAQSSSATDTAIPSVTITTGLDERMRSRLSNSSAIPFARSDAGTHAGSALRSTAARDSAANALRQGQALLRAGKPKEALIVLRSVESDVRATYWTARALEKLGRTDEALDLYRAVAKDETAGYLVERARNDAEFLEWKRTFAKKLDKSSDADTATPVGDPAPKVEPAPPAAKPEAPAKDAKKKDHA